MLSIARSNRTCHRDEPFFTVEVFPKSKPLLYAQLMRLVRSLGYRPFAIKETCGFPWDWCARRLISKFRALSPLLADCSHSRARGLAHAARGVLRGACSRNVLCVPEAKRHDFLSARQWSDWVNVTEIVIERRGA